MAYNAKGNYGYGSGKNGDVENPSGQINSYANVTNYATNTLTIGAPSNGIYETFVAGTTIMIHVSATNGTSQEFTYLGKYVLAKIISVAGSVLTIDEDFTKILPITEFTKYQVQVITVAEFNNLKLETATLTPLAHSIANKYGGILLAKCKDTITFSGGNINLVNKGILPGNIVYRPLTTQEQAGKGNADTDKYSAFENHITIREFLLNCGDGACMIWANKFVQNNTISRIGGTTAGEQFKRGDKGGSTIAIIANEIQNFTPAIISKNKNIGQGLGRCYIASNTKLRNDEGLYAYDCISTPLRIMKELNIKNYGDGSLGDVTNPTLPLNNYARVVNIDETGKVITYTNKTTNGIAQIALNGLVMFHVSKHIDSNDMKLLGKFIIGKVLADNNNIITLNVSVKNIFDITKLNKYKCQIISIPQFNNLTINTNYDKTPIWDNNTGTGGICAIAVKQLCNLENGKINVEAKGGGNAYEREGLAFIGNAQMFDMLPLGQGHGSVFLVANKCNINDNSRIGALYKGDFSNDTLGGRATAPYGIYVLGGGYQGGFDNQGVGSGGGYNGGGSHDLDLFYGGLGGSGAGGGTGRGNNYSENSFGGYGSNGKTTAITSPGRQGAHIMIVAFSLNKYIQKVFSTGGEKALGRYADNDNGSAGYGGGANDDLGDGGSSGWAFVYINEINEFDNNGVVAI